MIGPFLGMRRVVGAIASLSLLTVGIALVAAGGRNEAAATGATSGTVAGKVFQDYNANGVFDSAVGIGVATDVGVSGVLVRAFDGDGTPVGSSTTAANGTYTIAVSGAKSTAIRVEFSTPAGFQPSFVGTNSGSSIQFVTLNATSVDYAINDPGDYAQASPNIVTASQERGDQTTLQGILTFPSSIGATAPGGTKTIKTDVGAIGAVWGVGTDRQHNAFLGTYVKRHTAYGPAGATNTIYKYNVDTNAAPSVFVTLPLGSALPVHSAANSAPNAASAIPYFYDNNPAFQSTPASSVFYNVGRVGIGDVDVSRDGKTLYAVDMDEAAPKLYEVPISGSGAAVTAGTPVAHAIPAPGAGFVGACVGTWHPMGLGLRSDTVLVGGVCGGETTLPGTNLAGDPSKVRAFIYRWGGGSTFTPLFDFAMDYGRGCAFRIGSGETFCTITTSDTGTKATSQWGAWNQRVSSVSMAGTYSLGSNPQPMLSNIEIDDEGQLIISFRDRFADMAGPKLPLPGETTGTLHPITQGDMLRACINPAGPPTYILEDNGICGGVTGAGVANKGQGPKSSAQNVSGEFYEDSFTDGNFHDETGQGASALLPGGSGVYSTNFDPFDNRAYEQGVNFFNEAGAPTNGIELQLTTYGNSADGFGKGAGLADLELLLDPSPVQIGNRVWTDTNGNGLQDADELGISGVTVRLYNSGGTLVGTAVTDASGQYYFSSNNAEAATGNGDALGGGFAADATFTIKIDKASDYAAGGKLAGLILAKADVNANADDTIDSDAILGAGAVYGISKFPEIAVAAHAAGFSDHSLDAGFTTPYTLGNRVWVDVDNSGTVNGAEVGRDGVVVKLYVADVSGNPTGAALATATTASGGFYRFDNVTAGTYVVVVDSANFSGAGVLVSYLSSTGSTASVGAADVDKKDNGQDTALASGTVDPGGIRSAKVTLGSGLQPSGETDKPSPNPAGEAVDANSNLTIDFGFRPQIDLALVKTVATGTPGPYVPGADVDFTLTVTNNGPGTAAAGWKVTDLLPVGLTYRATAATSASATCAAASGQSVTCTGTGALVSAATAVVTVQATVSAGAPSSMTNVAYVAPAATDVAETNPLGSTPTASTDTVASATNNDSQAVISSTPTYAVGNYAWIDANHDGIQDGTEVGLNGVTVDLLDSSGVAIAGKSTTTATGPDGKLGFYVFDNLPAAGYQVRFTAPAVGGYLLTTPAQGTAATGSDPTPAAASSGKTATVTIGAADTNNRAPAPATDGTLLAGAIDPTIDAGFYQPINLKITKTTTSTNVQAGDSVTYNLTITNDGPGTAQTGYTVTELPPASFTITSMTGTGFTCTAPTCTSTGTLAAAATSTITVVATVGSSAAAGTSRNVAYVSPKPTNEVPESNVLAIPTAGLDTTTSATDNDAHADVTVLRFSLGNRVWLDMAVGLANDGVLNGAEAGQDGVTVKLYASDGFGAPTGAALATSTTSNGGYYRFDNLAAANYVVVVSSSNFVSGGALENYASSTGQTASVDASDADKRDHGADAKLGAGSVDVGGVTSGSIRLGIGYQPTGTDSDADPTSPAGESVDAQSNRTVDFGFYQSYSVGDRVWIDADHNGLQDSGEAGLNGVTVELLDATGAPIAGKSTVTATRNGVVGSYEFTGLAPDTYRVRFTLPSSYRWTTAGVGTDRSLDSNPTYTLNSDATVVTGPIVVSASKADTKGNPHALTDPTIDAGVYQVYALGDYVWEDQNGNGKQDLTEPIVQNVTVTLTDDLGNPVHDADGALVGTRTTDSNGHYVFDNLLSGTYQVAFSTLPSYFRFTTESVTGSTSLEDSNANEITGKSPVIILNSSNSALAVPVANDLTTKATLIDRTWDAGLIRSASVGNYVFEDVNYDGLQDSGDKPLAGVVLHLSTPAGANVTDIFGNAVTDVTTPANGGYRFANLAVGEYKVSVVSTPSGFVPTIGEVDATTGSSTGSATSSPATGSAALGGSDLTLDFGFVKPVSVGNYVFEDVNYDGLQDGTDVGIQGAVLRLYDASGTTQITTDAFNNAITDQTTGADGSYSFNNLKPGQYTVKVFSMPTGYVSTKPEVSPVTGSSTAFVASSTATGTAAISGGSDTTLDFGFFRPVSVGNYVFEDVNYDGLQDSGDTPIQGVMMHIVKADGTPALDITGAAVADRPTSTTGAYLFTNLVPGEYRVSVVSNPTGYVPTLTGQGTTTNDSSTSNATSSPTTGSAATSGGQDLTLDFGFVRPVSVGNYVWEDIDHDGVQLSGNDVPIQGAVLHLSHADGSVVATDASGAAVVDQTTGVDGSYLFANLLPGEYRVSVVSVPAGLVPTLTGQGTTATDSSRTSATSAPATGTAATSGGQDLTLDFGFVRAVSVGNFVFEDVNFDGIQDSGDKPIQGVMMHIVRVDEAPAVDTAGAAIPDRATSTTGAYLFSNLPPGEYRVSVVSNPSGFIPTRSGQGTTATDSSTGSAASSPATGTAATSGGQDLTLDFGFVKPVSVGNYVWEDVDHDGIQLAGNDVPLKDVVLHLSNLADGSAVVDASDNLVVDQLTGTDGSYLFSNLLPGQYKVTVVSTPANMIATIVGAGTTSTDSSAGFASTSSTTGTTATSGGSDLTLDFGFYTPVGVGDKVFEDLNHNGVQDIAEPGISGVVLHLTHADTTPAFDAGGAPVADLTTTSDGKYVFSNLPSGQYKVTVVSVPAGWLSTLTGAGTPSTDSSTGSATSAVLPSGSSDLTLDFGFYRPVSVGDFVFEDVNHDGIQDAGDRPIQGVTLHLVNADETQAVDTAGVAVADQSTSASGGYLFTNLPPGSYMVLVVTSPTGFVPTLTERGTSASDSSNGSVSSVVLPSGSSDLTLDFGFFKPVTVGNFVFEDLNHDGVQDAGDAPIQGVVLHLTLSDGSVAFDVAGVPVLDQTTDSTGNYLFANLPAGSYKVSVVTPPAGMVPTLTGAGTAATDSSTGSATSVLLLSGGSDLTLDFGFLRPVSVGDFVWVDANGNGVQDAAEPGLAGTVLHLTYLDGSAVTDASGVPVGDITTVASGAYLFSNLVPGEYRVVVVSVPGGYVPTKTGLGTLSTDSSTGSATSTPATGTAARSGGSDLTLDFGFYLPVSIGNFVWKDSNVDGIQSAGEVGVAGATITVKDALGVVVATVTSGSDGSYLVSGLPPGTYRVTIVAPAGLVLTGAGRGTSETDSNPDPLTSMTSVVSLTSGQSDLTIDAGLIDAARIEGNVYVDVDNNKILTGADTPIADVVVHLKGVTDFGQVLSLTVTTDAAGHYDFGDIPPGTYTLTEDQPLKYANAAENPGSKGGVPSINQLLGVVLHAGERAVANNFGETRQKLPATGSDIAQVLSLALMLLAAGTILVVAVRRRKDPSNVAD